MHKFQSCLRPGKKDQKNRRTKKNFPHKFSKCLMCLSAIPFSSPSVLGKRKNFFLVGCDATSSEWAMGRKDYYKGYQPSASIHSELKFFESILGTLFWRFEETLKSSFKLWSLFSQCLRIIRVFVEYYLFYWSNDWIQMASLINRLVDYDCFFSFWSTCSCNWRKFQIVDYNF